MTSTAMRELEARIAGEVRFDEPLAPYTTYRIGGPAAALVLPAQAADVVAALRFAAETGARWLALGLGSNLLVCDAGFDGVVIRLGKGLDTVEPSAAGDPHRWRVGAGLPTPLLARRTAQAGLGGVHRLIGVPGTVGGGVFMNAGAHGQDFSQVVRHVELAAGDGVVRVLPATDIAWRYRGSGLDGSVVLGATLELAPHDPARLEREIQQHFQWRKAGTPFNEPCCGSVFRNPAPRPPKPPVAAGAAGGGEVRTAGQLIDACGLKGLTIGGAQVSPVHANYIVNRGGATARDVLAVIEAVRKRVQQQFGVELELEVQIIE